MDKFREILKLQQQNPIKSQVLEVTSISQSNSAGKVENSSRSVYTTAVSMIRKAKSEVQSKEINMCFVC